MRTRELVIRMCEFAIYALIGLVAIDRLVGIG